MNFYNEHDPKAAAWLRELIKAGELPAGNVDERSISELTPNDLVGYTQCHFFAGIGGWSLALRLAGWPEDKPVWTGSCPCQPFSAAGSGLSVDDERHLWPDFRNLIGLSRPPIVFGEQVASALGRQWLAGVSADLEALAYPTCAADMCAPGVAAPHQRQRLFWMAHALHRQCQAGNGGHRGEENQEHKNRADAHRHGQQRLGRESAAANEFNGLAEPKSEGRPRMESQCQTGIIQRPRVGCSSSDVGLGQPNRPGRDTRKSPGAASGHGHSIESTSDRNSGLGHAISHGSAAGIPESPSRKEGTSRITENSNNTCDLRASNHTSGLAHPAGTERRPPAERRRDDHDRSDPGRQETDGGCSIHRPWDRYDLIPFRDGKTRRIEPGTFPLAHGVPGRVGLLRGYGNAIVPQLASAFIQAATEALNEA